MSRLSFYLLWSALVLAMCWRPVAAQQITLANERVLFETSILNFPGIGAAIAPGGKAMLYAVPQLQEAPKPNTKYLYKLYLLDLTSGFKRELGIGSIETQAAAFIMKHGLFSPAGDVCLLPDLRSGAVTPDNFVRPVLICDLATGRLTNTVLATDIRSYQIDSTGQSLIGVDGKVYPLRATATRSRGAAAPARATGAPAAASSSPDAPTTGPTIVMRPGTRPASLTTITSRLGGYTEGRGMLVAMSPTGMLGVYAITQYAANQLREGQSARVIVWDFSANKLEMSLPVAPDSDATDGHSIRFTSDGKFIFFRDGKAGLGKGRMLRVWDMQARRATVDLGAIRAIGVGPTPDTMYLANDRGLATLSLYNVAANTKIDIPMDKKDLEAVAADKIVYSRKEKLHTFYCVADVVVTP